MKAQPKKRVRPTMKRIRELERDLQEATWGSDSHERHVEAHRAVSEAYEQTSLGKLGEVIAALRGRWPWVSKKTIRRIIEKGA